MSGMLNRRKALALGGGAALGAMVAGAGTASAATGWIRLPIVTANIGRDNLGAREAAIDAVRNCDSLVRPLVGWQEINEGDTGEPAMIDHYFGPLYNNAFLRHNTSFRIPISIPQPWEVASSKTTYVHGGITGVTPPRWINEVVVRHQSHPTLQFALINSHYIANAYNGDQRADLRDEWNEHKRIHASRVLAHHNVGRLVFWTADTNNPNYYKATSLESERRCFGTGIDRINWLAGNGVVQEQFIDTKTVDMRVDGHDARVAVFQVRLA
ncbi:hypothetical protein DMC61_03880 [Amycolatopsis sp. WAC 04169]|uniref:Uncharacterized protein n=2 Tax=Pseudonocardiaceae TaxID=2070 RepID=R4SH12_9PSEU|nr:hypothetical protein AORI_0355 [Amycolatopsis keratiniphila]RSN37207.1 hypothetical protein DMC61_03880 [Amycolatopsis sp. WAC 04169]